MLYLIAIGWLYVALMMAVAEATNTQGTVLGAIITFVLYGLLPVGILTYLLSTPARRKALRLKEKTELAQAESALAATKNIATTANPDQSAVSTASPSAQPDRRSEAATDAIAPVREKL